MTDSIEHSDQFSDYNVIRKVTHRQKYPHGTSVAFIDVNKIKEEAMFLTDKFIDELMLPKVLKSPNGKFQYNYKWKESKDDYQFFLAVPGIKKEDIEIKILDGELLYITAPENEFINEQDIKVSLPRISDIDNIQARTEDGILIVTVPFVGPKTIPKIEVH